MAPRFWTVTVNGQTVKVVAGTLEAAKKIAAGRIGAPGPTQGRSGGSPDF